MDPHLSPWIESTLLTGQKPRSPPVIQFLTSSPTVLFLPGTDKEKLVRGVCSDGHTKINTIFTTDALNAFRTENPEFSQTPFKQFHYALLRLEDYNVGFAHNGPTLSVQRFVYLAPNFAEEQLYSTPNGHITFLSAPDYGPVHSRMRQEQQHQAAQRYEAGWLPKHAIEAALNENQHQTQAHPHNTGEEDMDLDDGIGHEPRSFSQIESDFNWDQQKKEPPSEISSYGPDQNEMDDSNYVEVKRVHFDVQPVISTPSPATSPVKRSIAAAVPEAASTNIVANGNVGGGSGSRLGEAELPNSPRPSRSDAAPADRGTQDDSVGFSLTDNQAGMLDVLASQAQHKDTASLPFGSGSGGVATPSPDDINKVSPPAPVASQQDPPHAAAPAPIDNDFSQLPPIIADPPSTPESDGWEEQRNDAADQQNQQPAGPFHESIPEPELSSDADDAPHPAAPVVLPATAATPRGARIIPEYDESILDMTTNNRYLNNSLVAAGPDLSLSPPMTQLPTQIPGMSPPPPASQQSQPVETQLPTVASLPSGPAAQQIVSLDIIGGPTPLGGEESSQVHAAAPEPDHILPKPATQKRRRPVADDSVLAESDSEESNASSQRSDISNRRRKAAASQKPTPTNRSNDIMLLDDLEDLGIEIASEPTPPKPPSQVEAAKSPSEPTPAPVPAAAAVDTSIDVFGSGNSKASPQSPLPSRSSSSPFSTPLRHGANKSAEAPSPSSSLTPPKQAEQQQQNTRDTPTRDIVVTLRKRAPNQPPSQSPKITAAGQRQPRTFKEDVYGVDEADDFFDSASIPRKTAPRKSFEKSSPPPAPVPAPAPAAPEESAKSKPGRKASAVASVENQSSSDTSRPREKRFIKDDLGPVVEVEGPRRRKSLLASPSPSQAAEDSPGAATAAPPVKDSLNTSRRRRQSTEGEEEKSRSASAQFKAIEESSSRKKRKIEETATDDDEDHSAAAVEDASSKKRRKTTDDSVEPNAVAQMPTSRRQSDTNAPELAVVIQRPKSPNASADSSPEIEKSSSFSSAAGNKEVKQKKKRKSLDSAAAASSADADFATASAAAAEDDNTPPHSDEPRRKRRKTSENASAASVIADFVAAAAADPNQSKISSYFEPSKSKRNLDHVVPDTPQQAIVKPRPRRSSSAGSVGSSNEIQAITTIEDDDILVNPATSEEYVKHPTKQRPHSPSKSRTTDRNSNNSSINHQANVDEPPKKRALEKPAAAPKSPPAVAAIAKPQQKPLERISPAATKPISKEATQPAARSASPTRSKTTGAKPQHQQPAQASNRRQTEADKSFGASQEIFLDLVTDSSSSSQQQQQKNKKPPPLKPWRQQEHGATVEAPDSEAHVPNPIQVFESGPSSRNQRKQQDDDDDFSEEWIQPSSPPRFGPAHLRAAQIEQEKRRAAIAQKRSTAAIGRASSIPAATSPAPLHQQPRPSKASSGPLLGQQQPAIQRAKPAQPVQGRPVVPPRNSNGNKPSSSRQAPAPHDNAGDEDDDPFADFADVKPLASLLKKNK
eukprot:TRINITY_DN6223_c0_g1_i1.p1 TRINITY_DN6223_c0_g1~~TRINITY_DN6223_c0_g1_i1.p1  ORF type:complete len:1516 (-),score=375.95 TRINITY_DN6223_c0_g1_i1:33-4580(-)